MFLYIFNNNKKVTNLNRDIHPGDSWPYVSCVRCNLSLPFLSFFLSFFLYKVVKLVSGCSVINGATQSTFQETWCSQCCSTNTFVIDSFIDSLPESSFMLTSSKQCLCQTLKARELNSLREWSPPTIITCHMPHVTCHMSYITLTWPMSHVKCYKFVRQSGRASQYRVCYQRGLHV